MGTNSLCSSAERHPNLGGLYAPRLHLTQKYSVRVVRHVFDLSAQMRARGQPNGVCHRENTWTFPIIRGWIRASEAKFETNLQ